MPNSAPPKTHPKTITLISMEFIESPEQILIIRSPKSKRTGPEVLKVLSPLFWHTLSKRFLHEGQLIAH